MGATAGSAALISGPAWAKMSTADEQLYREAKQAALALSKGKEYDKAKAKYEEAKDLAVKGDDKKKEYKTLICIGEVCIFQSDYPGAESAYREALALAEGHAEIGEGPLAHCLYQLAWVLQKEKRDNDARPFFTRSIEISRKIYSTNHPSLAVRTSEYASLLAKLGEKEEAAKLAKQSQSEIDNFMSDMGAKIERAWQPTPEKYSYRVGVDYLVLNHGKVDKVEVTKSSGSPIADKAAVDAVKAAAPFSDITCADAEDELNLTFNFDYNADRNTRLKADALKIGKTVPPTHQTREDQDRALRVLQAEKEKAENLKSELEKQLKSSPDDPAKLADLCVKYADSLNKQGEHQAALDVLDAALSRDCFIDANTVPTLSLRVALAHSYLNKGAESQAASGLQQVLASKAFAQLSPDLRREAYEDYGNALSKLHKFAEAQDYYSKARELNQ